MRLPEPCAVCHVSRSPSVAARCIPHLGFRALSVCSLVARLVPACWRALSPVLPAMLFSRELGALSSGGPSSLTLHTWAVSNRDCGNPKPAGSWGCALLLTTSVLRAFRQVRWPRAQRAVPGATPEPLLRPRWCVAAGGPLLAPLGNDGVGACPGHIVGPGRLSEATKLNCRRGSPH